MQHFDDIGAGVAEDRADLAECAGHVREFDAQARQPSVPDQAPHDDGSEQPGVDVAAAEHDPDPFAAEPTWMGEERGEPGRTRTFAHDLFDVEEGVDGPFQLLFGDGDDVVDERIEYRRCDLAGGGDGDAFGEGGATFGRRWFAVEVGGHRGVALDLYADQVDVGSQVAGDDGRAGEQPTSTDLDGQRVEVGWSSSSSATQVA